LGNKAIEIMKATQAQTECIENLEKKYLITVIDYGFYSNGEVGVKCKDSDGIFKISIDKKGNITG
jgi:hypothetical protein